MCVYIYTHTHTRCFRNKEREIKKLPESPSDHGNKPEESSVKKFPESEEALGENRRGRENWGREAEDLLGEKEEREGQRENSLGREKNEEEEKKAEKQRVAEDSAIVVARRRERKKGIAEKREGEGKQPN